LWIVSGSSEFKKSCLRGLFDTDGCVIIHRYEIRGKLYRYKKLSFTSASPKLINDVSALLCELGIKSRVARGGRDVFIDSKTMVEKYFQVVDTNNSKNMERYHS
jgi:intein/homing endonuclease